MNDCKSTIIFLICAVIIALLLAVLSDWLGEDERDDELF